MPLYVDGESYEGDLVERCVVCGHTITCHVRDDDHWTHWTCPECGAGQHLAALLCLSRRDAPPCSWRGSLAAHHYPISLVAGLT